VPLLVPYIQTSSMMVKLLACTAPIMIAPVFMHDCCGRHVIAGHLVRFKREMQEVVYRTPGEPKPDVRIKPVIKVVLILDGTE
jgi:hypothetical protein